MFEMQADENRKSKRSMSNEINAIEMDPPDFTVLNKFNFIVRQR